MSIVEAPITVPIADLARIEKSRAKYWSTTEDITRQRRDVEHERQAIAIERQQIVEGLREHARLGEYLQTQATEQRRSLDEREVTLRKRQAALDAQLRRAIAGE